MSEKSLTYEVYVSSQLPTTVTDTPPDLDRRMWSPTSSTLIQGARDAVLVDPLMAIDQVHDLLEWVAQRGKRLVAVYITHGHGDHWFGLAEVLRRHPGAKALAMPAVVERMRAQADPETFQGFWRKRFPGQIASDLVLAQAMEDSTIELEGHALRAIPLGHTDTDDSTCLHVPSIGLVVAGDAVYNNVHLFLAESPAPKRREWLAALDRLEALEPTAVVAGHKDPSLGDSPQAIDLTRQYIADFEQLARSTSTATELYEGMIALHPTRINRGALWGSARFEKG